jgi:hypothetical protein
VDVTACDLPGWPRPTGRDVLATVAAVAQLPSSASDEFLDAVASFPGVSRADLLAIVAAMIERGVIVERGEQLRIARTSSPTRYSIRLRPFAAATPASSPGCGRRSASTPGRTCW